MKNKIIIFVLILFLGTSTIQANAITSPSVTSKSALLIDLDTGQPLYEKNINQKLAPASTTKILTALIVLDKCKLTDKVIVGKNPTLQEPTRLPVMIGEQLTVEQLLYSMMLKSANDAAYALAEFVGGSSKSFSILMNEKARELGCKNSNFVTPNGLPNDKHYTTAYDLALITKKAMENPIFRKIVSTKSYKILPTNKYKTTRVIFNHNKLLFNQKYKLQGINGVKTGYTFKAKQTYVGSATRGNKRLAVVLLKDEFPAYLDAIKLLNYGFNNFIHSKLLSKNIKVYDLKIGNGNTKIPLYPQKDMYIYIKRSEKPVINKKFTFFDNITSIKKGQTLGYVEITINGKLKNQVSLISGSDYQSSLFSIKGDNKGNYKKSFKLRYVIIPLLLAFAAFLSRGFYRKWKRKMKENPKKKNKKPRNDDDIYWD